jgi:hypothetical protein
MITLFKGLRVALLVGLGAALVAHGSPAAQKSKADDKKAEKTKNGNPPADSPITVDFKISVAGLDPIPPSSTVEFKGLNDCPASGTGRLNAEGQGRFKTLTSCVVELKIFISSEMRTKIAQVDVSKYRGSAVKVEITTSSEEHKVTYPGPSPTPSPTK